jgi:hypothetical protein
MQPVVFIEVGVIMRTIVDPGQRQLFDPFDRVLTPKARKRLLSDWPGVFRHVILELMPVKSVGSSFHPSLGRPSKELYSMAGLLFLKEFMNWTLDEAVAAYMFRMDVHYALNLEPVAHDLSRRTLELYLGRFVEDELAAGVMHTVTTTLVKALDLKIDRQRLDSTHIFSDMASFGRTRMMGVAIKRFLVQVKRFDHAGYEMLAEDLRRRYEPGTHRLFGDWGKEAEARHRLRQQVAEDMHALIQRFGGDAAHSHRPTYKALERIFYEQCVVDEEKVEVKAKTGGNVMQNPSDAGATYDGHKGPGYQVQIAETCNAENEIQLLTSALPQTAVESDTTALPEVLDDLEAQEMLPEELFADTLYCSDENVQGAEARGVELVGPTKEGAESVDGANAQTIQEAESRAYALDIDDFVVDEESGVVVRCPAGHEPEFSEPDQQKGKTITVMPDAACSQCEFAHECPVRRVRGRYQLDHTAKQRRLAARRREEQTPVFRERYRIRAGIESTNSGIKRRTGLNRLRVRGKARVFNAIWLRLAGWNILRAAASAKMRELVAERAKTPSFAALLAQIRVRIRLFAFPEALGRIMRLRKPDLSSHQTPQAAA